MEYNKLKKENWNVDDDRFCRNSLNIINYVQNEGFLFGAP